MLSLDFVIAALNSSDCFVVYVVKDDKRIGLYGTIHRMVVRYAHDNVPISDVAKAAESVLSPTGAVVSGIDGREHGYYMLYVMLPHNA